LKLVKAQQPLQYMNRKGAFNQQVKNNIQKFDDDFRFQLTKEEWENLRSKFLTSSWGGTRYLPYAFTEQGIYMLMTVLKGDLAARQSKSIIRLFKKEKPSMWLFPCSFPWPGCPEFRSI